MAVSLLDVNILVALFSEDASSHTAAQKWFLHNAHRGWATCPVTQAGFVRIICNPAASKSGILPAQALEILEEGMQHPSHQFWPDDISFAEAVSPFRSQVRGHQQITYAYLLGLARRHKGRLVTGDRAIASVASTAGFPNLVTLVSS